MKKALTYSIVSGFCLVALSVPFENIKFSQNIETQAVDVANVALERTNLVVFIKSPDSQTSGIQQEKISHANGIILDIYEDGDLKIFFDETDDDRNPMDRIFVNEKPLSQEIQERIDQGIQNNNQTMQQTTPQGVTNLFLGMTYNPLWGKKLAIIGDSLTVSPSADKSYAAFIAQRNNMILVHKGRSGEKLCNDRTNELGQTTNPSTIKSYTNDIPADTDFILCQIGTNDTDDWWARDEGLDIPDTDMSTNTFKGCWNNLLVGLKINYPNARIGMILPHCWNFNLGTNSEDVVLAGKRRRLSNWQKLQCNRLNIPVFDPVTDTRMVLWNAKSYATNGVDITSTEIQDSALDWFEQTKRRMGTSNNKYSERYGLWQFQSPYFVDSVHQTEKGALYLSFYYEQWMKTTLMTY